MLRLDKERTVTRTIFGRIEVNLNAELQKDNSTEVEGLFNELEDRARSIFTLDERIKDLMIDDATAEQLLEEYEICRGYKKTLEQYRTKVEVFKKKGQVIPPAQECSSGFVNNDRDSILYKFPKIEPKKFGGDPKDWLQFWGQFKKIDENQKIRNEDKFQFLVQSMVEGSKAKEIVESFPHSAENYPKAIRHLKSRFGNEDTLVEVYVRELLRLVLNTALNSKQKVNLSSLYDKLETQLRALESLGVTSEKYASILFPLVESSLPEEVLRAWERHRSSTLFFGQDANRLSQIMDFLRAEVEGEERISLARSGFGFSVENERKFFRKKEYEEDIPTAAGLFSANDNSGIRNTNCIFCDGIHASHKCYQGKKMTLEDKRNAVMQKKACFSCLKVGHIASSNKCSNLKISCEICSRKHYVMMCPELEAHKSENNKFASEICVIPETKENTLANQTCSSEVAMKTLKVRVTGNGKEKIIRVVIDDGSHRTYLSKKIIKYFQFKNVSQEKIIHSLFGGVESGEVLHNRYEISVFALDRDYKCRISVLDQDKICGDIVPVAKGPWIEEFQKENIKFTDIHGDSTEVDMLIGADIAGKLLTGKICQLNNGLTAIETNLGWTMMGRIPLNKPKIRHDTTLLVHSLFAQEANIHDVLSLDSLDITNTTDRLLKEESQQVTKTNFLETVKKNKEKEGVIKKVPKEEKGPDLLELIPSVLSKLEDRNFVKFLWWEGDDQTLLKQYDIEEKISDRREKAKCRTYFYKNEEQCDKNAIPFLKSILIVGSEQLKAKEPEDPTARFAAIKLTALSRPKLLIPLSEAISKVHQYISSFNGKFRDGNVLEHQMTPKDLGKELEKAAKANPEFNDWFNRLVSDDSRLIHIMPWDLAIQAKTQLNRAIKVPNIKSGIMDNLARPLSENEEKISRQIAIGDIVLIGNDEQKRIDWPLGKVVELFPGKDGYVRVVRVKTINGLYLRPIQRLYLMELNPEESKKLKIGLAVSSVVESPS